MKWLDISEAPHDGTEVLTFPHSRKAYWDKHFKKWVKKSIAHNTLVPLRPQPTHYIDLIEDPTE